MNQSVISLTIKKPVRTVISINGMLIESKIISINKEYTTLKFKDNVTHREKTIIIPTDELIEMNYLCEKYGDFSHFAIEYGLLYDPS